MALRKIRKLFVVCIIVGICFALSGTAGANNSESVCLSDLCRERLDISALEYTDSQDMLRVSGSVNISISTLSGATVDDSFTLAVNDTITYNCSYTPKSASVDFGFIAPDGYMESGGSMIFYKEIPLSGLVGGVSGKSLTFVQAMSCMEQNEGYTTPNSGSYFKNVQFSNTIVYSQGIGGRPLLTMGPATYFTFICKPDHISYNFDDAKNTEIVSIEYR